MGSFTAQQYQAIAMMDEEKKKQTAAGWSREQEMILKTWAEKAAGYRWLHEQSARHYRRLNNRYVYPQIVLSTLAGVGGFGATSSNQPKFNYFGYIIAGMNIFTALLSSFQKFMMSAEKSEIHATVARQFAAYYRNISLELALNPRDRTDCLELCKACRNEYDRLMNVAPSVPQKIINQFKDKFPHAKNKPDIANGLSDMHIWDKTEGTKSEDAFRKMRNFYKLMYKTRTSAPPTPTTPGGEKNLPV